MRRLNPLEKFIKKHIEDNGPLPIAEYMALCLTHPTMGYYMRGASVGKDFVTAPEISQMFGELIGIWALSVWQNMGEPTSFNLVEFGPGRGTMMADLLRATSKWGRFSSAMNIHFVEASPSLRRIQEGMIHPKTATWHDGADTLPEGPSIILANEFFDALPIRQLVKTAENWSERKVSWNEDKEIFEFIVEPVQSAFAPLVPEMFKTAKDGEIFEFSPLGNSLIHFIGEHIAQNTGAALVIDYGKAHTDLRSTFQAVKLHRKVDVLEDCGEADLTAFVDFEMFSKALSNVKCDVYGAVHQADFLNSLGLEIRAHTLEKKGVKEEVRRSVERLTAPNEMGELFKAMAIVSKGLPIPPGFDELTHG